MKKFKITFKAEGPAKGLAGVLKSEKIVEADKYYLQGNDYLFVVEVPMGEDDQWANGEQRNRDDVVCTVPREQVLYIEEVQE